MKNGTRTFSSHFKKTISCLAAASPSFILHFLPSCLGAFVACISGQSLVALSARTIWTMPQVRLVARADAKPTFFNNSII